MGVVGRTKTEPQAPIVVAYARVSTAEQHAGIDAQRAALAAECERRGWEPEWVIDQGVSGGTAPDARPGLGPALQALDQRGGVLVAARFDRIARSLADLALLLDRALARGWTILVVDAAGLDLTTPTGRMVAGVLGSVAAFERDLIRARTREALAARKAAGVKLGRPRLVDPALTRRVCELRAQGMTLWGIADLLNDEGTLTPTGKRWSAALVRKLTLRAAEVA
jgi:DNA invertase Pin-like site-specific DNA recombinase